MDRNRLRQILAAYGGHPDRWPADEREAALALLHDAPELLDIQRAEQSLDDALDGWSVDDPSPALFDAVMPKSASAEVELPVFTAGGSSASSGILDRLADRLRELLTQPIAATALACSIAAAGFSVGWVSPEQASDDLLVTEVSDLILPGNDLAGLQ